MDPRTIGQLISGFGAKCIVAGVAIYVAAYACIAVVDAFARINNAFGG